MYDNPLLIGVYLVTHKNGGDNETQQHLRLDAAERRREKKKRKKEEKMEIARGTSFGGGRGGGKRKDTKRQRISAQSDCI